MRLVNKILVLCTVIFAFSSNLALAKTDDRTSVAVGLVKKYLQKLNVGPEADAFNAINTKPANDNPKFVIIVYDFDGTIKAWSFIPSYVGKNVSTLADLNGNKALLDVIKKAKSAPTGWYDFKTNNPVLGTSGNIKSYYEVFNNYIVACGYFE
jgi:signal transduction histidine kinase